MVRRECGVQRVVGHMKDSGEERVRGTEGIGEGGHIMDSEDIQQDIHSGRISGNPIDISDYVNITKPTSDEI